MKAPVFDPIEEMKDPKYEEMTMSKIDSELVASDVANKENTSLIINNQKYVEVPVTSSGPTLVTHTSHTE